MENIKEIEVKVEKLEDKKLKKDLLEQLKEKFNSKEVLK